MSDTPCTANVEKHSAVEVLESANAIYEQSKAERKPRYLFTAQLPAGSSKDVYLANNRNLFLQEGRSADMLGPARVMDYA